MKFLIFAPEQHAPWIEGIQKAAHLSTAELARSGHTCDIVSQYSFGDQPEQPFFETLSCAQSKLQKYCAWFGSARRILRAEKKNPHDRIVLFSADWSFIPALYLLSLARSKTPITVCVFSTRECKGITRILLRRLRTRAQFWCAAPRVQALLEEIGVPTTAITCAPVFFTASLMHSATSTAKEVGTVGYFSASDPDAGIDTVAALAAAVPSAKITLAVRAFSDTKEAAVRARLNHIHATYPSITIVRNIPDMGAFLARTETVILPPAHEDATMAVPLVALEAAHTGARVIMKNLPVFSGLFESGLAQPFETAADLAQLISAPYTPAQKNPTLLTLSEFTHFLSRND